MNSSWLVVWMAIGCAGTPAETVPTPPVVPAVETPAPPPVAETTAPPPVVGEAPPPAAAGLTVVVDVTKQTAAGPSDIGVPVTVVASPKTNRIDVAIDDLLTYCAPDPSFTAVAKPEALELTLVRPDGVSRCVGTHHVEAHVDLPGRNNLRKVVVFDYEGKVLGEAPIASAR